MSDASRRLKNILLRNRAALGLKITISDESENSDSDLDNLNKTLTPGGQDELVDLLENLSLDNNKPKMENLRFHTSLLPTFSGNQDHLESFILSVDEFYSLYYNHGEDQKKVVLAAIKSKLVDDARNFLLSRPDLIDWNVIKVALRQKFGDPITYLILMQQLQYIKINKNENILEFVDRLKNFMRRIISKIQCEVQEQDSKSILISQVEHTSVLILTANSPQTLKTMLMLQLPKTLDAALTHVVNYNMIESQVNFTNSNNSTLQNTIPKQNHNNINRNFNKPIFNAQQPFIMQQPHIPRPQIFPSQPVHVQPRQIQRHFPTNAQVFGKRPNSSYQQNNAPRRDAPVPMSISTAGPSRVQQQRQPSLNYPNFFQPTGPRNFTSQELSNVEINPHHDPYMPNQSSEPSQDFDTYYSYPEEQPSPQDTPDQNLDFENFENNEENFENFPKLASNPELT